MRGLTLGAVAGAAGTLALDMISYGDMAVRGRASSDMPAEVVRRVSEKVDFTPLSVPNERADDVTKNRRSAVGALTGYSIGIGIGALYGACAYAMPPGRRGTLNQSLFLAGIAMAASDVPAQLLGATNVKEWSPASWASDIVPHIAYGVITAAVFAAIANHD
jgi:hypothetical protein